MSAGHDGVNVDEAYPNHGPRRRCSYCIANAHWKAAMTLVPMAERPESDLAPLAAEAKRLQHCYLPRLRRTP